MEEPLVHQGDDALFAAAPSIDSGADDIDLLIPIAAIDEKYAGKLQLQEVLVSSFLSTTPHVHHDESPNIDFHQVDQSTVIYIDPKGKAVIESDSPSTSQDRSKTANCGICMEDKPVADFFEIGECKHKFCEECVGQYVAVKVEEKVASIGCPEAGCGVRMEMEMCQGILRPEVFERWGMAMCELMVEERFYCPYNDCSAMMMYGGSSSLQCPSIVCQNSYRERLFATMFVQIAALVCKCDFIKQVDHDGGEVIRASECSHCNRLFCAQCRVAWHGDIECSEFQALGDGEREREDLLLRNVAKDCKWQRCSKCGYYVEKIDGCMFIKCRCGHGFCYSCASPMGDDHYCIECLR